MMLNIISVLVVLASTRVNGLNSVGDEDHFPMIYQYNLLPAPDNETGKLLNWQGASKNNLLNKEAANLMERAELQLNQHQQQEQLSSPTDQTETTLALDGKGLESYITKQNAKITSEYHTEITSDGIILDDNEEMLGVSTNWTKRQAGSSGSSHQTAVDLKYSADDEFLENLQPDYSCLEKLSTCSMIPLKMMDCVLHCYLSVNAVAKENTKFLFRMMKVLTPFAEQLCQTFGTIYDQIQTDILVGHHQKNSLLGFLEGAKVDISQPNSNLEMFTSNAQLTLFNNLINHGISNDFQIVKPILSIAASWWNAETADLQSFPSEYSNPMCPKMPRQQWLVSMIDAMTQHPVNADIFLKGYYVLTRGLSQKLPYPIDNMFASSVFAMKMMTGVDCSLVSYAEQGVNFVCLEQPSIDAVLNDYATTAKEDENPMSWFVCGAHQIEMPDWKQKPEKEEGGQEGDDNDEKLAGRSGGVKPGGDVVVTYVDEDPANPEEMYNYDSS